jgi:hypothetical protein
LYQQTPLPNLRHFHMEYVQFLLEIGFIGLILIIAFIKKFLEIQSTSILMFAVKLIFIGFLISCCFNYPAHLWMTSVYACFAYAAFMVLKRGDTNARIN